MGLKLLRFAIALAVVTGVSGFGLAKVFLLTEPMINEQKVKAEQEAKKVLFKDATDFEKKEADGFEYEVAKKDGQELGILFKAAKNGYSSTIVSLVGIDKNDKIVGVVILNQQETPGLGARMEEIKSNKYIWTFWKKDENSHARPWFQNMYVGVNPGELNLVKGTEWKDMDDAKQKELRENSTITALSGATISTNANMESIKEAYSKLSAALKSSKSEVVAETDVSLSSVESSVVDTTVVDSVKEDSTAVGEKNE